MTRNNRMTAKNTEAVCNNAIAEASSVEAVIQELTIAGAITFEFADIKKIDAPSSRTEEMKINSHAATIPGRNNGNVTVRICWLQEAPQTRAHSSRLLSICSTTPASVRNPNGYSTVR